MYCAIRHIRPWIIAYLRVWFKAIFLAIPTFCGVIIFAVYFWVFLTLGVGAAIAAHSLEPLFDLIPMLSLCLAGGMIWYLLLRGFHLMVLKGLWWMVQGVRSHPPRWQIPAPRISGLAWQVGVAILATLPLTLLLMQQTNVKSCEQTFVAAKLVHPANQAQLCLALILRDLKLTLLPPTPHRSLHAFHLVGLWLTTATHVFLVQNLLAQYGRWRSALLSKPHRALPSVPSVHQLEPLKQLDRQAKVKRHTKR
jgi:hypothetical protein